MDPRVASEVSITDLFDQFIEASTMTNVLSIFHRILNYADLSPCEYNVFFPKLKRALMTTRVRKNWKAKALFSKIDKKAAHRCYSNTKAPTPLGTRPTAHHNNHSMNSQENLDDSMSSAHSTRQYYSNNALQHHNCLIIGSGPAGLRTAIELQLLGASRVVVVEKRSRFSRNNVLHLWPFVIHDLKSLGAKKFYGKFCAGSIDHISIRQLQLILLKICLMIGCDFRDSCSYLHLCPTSINQNKQIAKTVNNSDNSKAYGSSDSVQSVTSKCDLDSEELSIKDEFTKVSEALSIDTNEQSTVNCRTQDVSNDTDGEHVTQAKEGQMSDESPKTKDENDKETLPDVRLNGSEIRQSPNGRSENLRGCRAHFKSEYQFQEKELHSIEWDIIIGADGRRNTLSKFFPRKEFRGRLAIAITANFINRQTPLEASVPEISGLSFIYNQDMFNALAYDTNIQLENICYYKDDTHYFVMTAKKKSLLERGVLINDYAATQDLLADSNVDRQALLKYAKDAAYWTTGLEPLDFALNHYGQEDCAMFDFTSMYAASNACKALRTKGGGLTLVSLVGDSLLEPFWPTGSGCARGFLSSFDASWMCRQWAVNRCAIIDHHNSISVSRSSNCSPNVMCNRGKATEPTTYNRMALSVMAERESIYRILAQTTSENLQQNYSHWTLNPHSRYPNLNRHLVIPSQIEHLLADADFKCHATTSGSKNKHTTNPERSRRVKSPSSSTNARKSPKKLKSANSSPLTQNRNFRASSNSRQSTKSKRHDANLDDTYLEFERSYNNLADSEHGPNQYLNYKRPDCDLYDELFVPSLSGTLPSSNNLLSLEARRARDIDECLRQRRQKTQINVVRDQIIGQLRGHSVCRDDIGADKGPKGGGAVLFNELRRLREQQSKGKENRSKDVSSLTLLNSMRRCASFAERVKSFESKLSTSNSQDSTPVTPKTPDSVKNLPHFATLQELFIGNSSQNLDESKKSKIPIMKLSKDDWNVKCWEKRLAAYKQKAANNFTGSSKSLNKTASVDGYHHIGNKKPEKQVEVFKDRIKEMAEKLKTARSDNHKLYSGLDDGTNDTCLQAKNADNRPQQGWVRHLRQELIKGATGNRYNAGNKQAMNPVDRSKPIKKLFEDDNEDDRTHYDHLCVNRPTNKYLSRNNGYSSHLVRSKYNSATSKVINRQPPSSANKQAYLTALTSRGSSASSTLSDYSTNTGGSNSTGTGCNNKDIDDKCIRCKQTIDSVSEKISIGEANLHRKCLTCADCSLTLRTNEIHHHLKLLKDSGDLGDEECDFFCAICKPSVRSQPIETEANKEADSMMQALKDQNGRTALRSREDFLNERINYNELYKNILDKNIQTSSDHTNRADHSAVSNQPLKDHTSTRVSQDQNSLPHENQNSRSEKDEERVVHDHHMGKTSPSPEQVTLPLGLINQATDSDTKASYRIARCETIDGSEQVTLVLPETDDRPDHKSGPGKSMMVDEEELERFHHPDRKADRSPSSSSSSDDSKDASSEASDDVDEQDEEQQLDAQLSDDPSSLNSPPNTEDFDDDSDEDDDDVDGNSTHGDFLTSEEFGPVSDREDDPEVESLDDTEGTISQDASNKVRVCSD